MPRSPTRFRPWLAPITLTLGLGCAGATVAQTEAPTAPEWVIVTSNSQAAMGVDRRSITREGDSVTAAILLGTYRDETIESDDPVRYYVSRETFDCALKTRSERGIDMFGPSGESVGPAPYVPDAQPIGSNTLAEQVLNALCAGGPAADQPGVGDALSAIGREKDRRLAAGLAVQE